jgi:hypothetical protein
MQLGTVLGASVWRRPGRAPRGLALIGDSPSIRIADKGRTRIRQCLVRRPTSHAERIRPHLRRGPRYQTVTGRFRVQATETTACQAKRVRADTGDFEGLVHGDTQQSAP